jgi:hypothetical protein
MLHFIESRAMRLVWSKLVRQKFQHYLSEFKIRTYKGKQNGQFIHRFQQYQCVLMKSTVFSSFLRSMILLSREECYVLVSCSVYSSTLKVKMKGFSETSVDFQRTTWRYIPEDTALRNHRCEHLQSSLHSVVTKYFPYQYMDTPSYTGLSPLFMSQIFKTSLRTAILFP